MTFLDEVRAARLFRLFSLIGCRGVCYAPGAAHSNLSDYAMAQMLYIFFFSSLCRSLPPFFFLFFFAYSAFFIMLFHDLFHSEFESHRARRYIGTTVLWRVAGICITSRLFYFSAGRAATAGPGQRL